MVEQDVEEYCLHFENHAGILMKSLQNFLKCKAFADVTLVCSNLKRIKAHKIILAAFSPFFENLLMDESNPIIYFDIPEQEIKAILEFIYTGSLDIPNTFAIKLLRTAKRLQIRGFERYDSEVVQPIRNSPQKATVSPPPSPIMKLDNTAKVINPFALQRRVEDSDSTCSEDELFSRAKTRKCENQEAPVNREPDDDSDVEFVEENPSVVVVKDTQEPDSPLWFSKTVPKNKRRLTTRPYVRNKENDSSDSEKSSVEENIADLETTELAPHTSTPENQSTIKKTAVHKAKEESNSSLTENELIKGGFGDLISYCVLCETFEKNIQQHINCLHDTPHKRKSSKCQVCSKKYSMEYGLQKHQCTT